MTYQLTREQQAALETLVSQGRFVSIEQAIEFALSQIDDEGSPDETAALIEEGRRAANEGRVLSLDEFRRDMAAQLNARR